MKITQARFNQLCADIEILKTMVGYLVVSRKYIPKAEGESAAAKLAELKIAEDFLDMQMNRLKAYLDKDVWYTR